MSRSELTHSELTLALQALRIGMGASDLHGSLTGYLCAGGLAGIDAWPAALEVDPDPRAAAADHEVLRRLYRECRAQLDDPDVDFDPLLPESGASIERRAEALVEWCRGFLGGVGLSGAKPRALSAEATEVLTDIDRIASSRFDYDDEAEDESAFLEVLEFVRVGVLLLHAELTRRPIAASRSVH